MSPIFYLKVATVLSSWRFYSLFREETTLDYNPEDKTYRAREATFQERVSNNFYALFTDVAAVLGFVLTCTLFFWRAKGLCVLLKNKPSKEWKEIIWNEFYVGGVAWGSVALLLLVKWPVVFSVLWNMGTEKEEKATWGEIFMKEFTKPNSMSNAKERYEKEKEETEKDGGAKSSKKSVDEKELDQWRYEFRRDLQNIGFEFDEDGEIKRFPPDEVVAQYQKSERFREMMFSAGNLSKKQEEREKNTKEGQSSSSSSSKSKPLGDQEFEIEEYTNSTIYNQEDYNYHNDKAYKEIQEERKKKQESTKNRKKKI